MVQFNEISTVLKATVTQSLAESNSFNQCRKKDKLFLWIAFGGFATGYDTKYEEV